MLHLKQNRHHSSFTRPTPTPSSPPLIQTHSSQHFFSQLFTPIRFSSVSRITPAYLNIILSFPFPSRATEAILMPCLSKEGIEELQYI